MKFQKFRIYCFSFLQSSGHFYFDLARGTEEAQVFGRHKTEMGGEGRERKAQKANFKGRPFPSLPNLLSLFLPFLSPFDACYAATVNAWSISNSPLFMKRKKLFCIKITGRLYKVKVIEQLGSSPQ